MFMYFYCYVCVVFCFIVLFCVNMFVHLTPVLNPVEVNKYLYINKTYHVSTG